jgi:fatty acid desaturase
MSTPHFSTPEGAHRLRVALRRELGNAAFEPVPWRGVCALLQVPVYIGLAAVVVAGVAPAWVDLVIGLVVGQMVTSVGLIAHETLHRSTFRSRFWMQVVGWIGFGWFGLTPGNWNAWHVLAHHGNTQGGGVDPDELMTLERYRSSRLARFIHAVTPGSGTWISWISFSFLFTLQGQLFLWYYIDQPEYAKIRIHKTRERVLTLLEWAGWAALAWAIGPWAALCVIGVPMATANATLMMYISTNHWLRPVTRDHNNPFTNTTSVIVPGWMDWIHVAFSYHQEHHIFPQMSPKHAPLLRAALQRLEPDAVVAWPIVPVMRTLFTTPSIYRDDHTLVDADGSGAIDVREVAARFQVVPAADAVAAR